MQLLIRVKNMLVSPKTEWLVIAGESSDVKTVYLHYVMILAAIPPLCRFLATTLFFRNFGINPAIGLEAALLRYLVSLATVYVVALIASKLAPIFAGRDDMAQAVKLIAYSATAAWLGGIFLLLPIFVVLTAVMALYSLYLLYVGVAPIMHVPPERVVPYTVAMIMAVIVVLFVMSLVFLALGGPILM